MLYAIYIYIFKYVSLLKSKWRFATKLFGITPHSLVNWTQFSLWENNTRYYRFIKNHCFSEISKYSDFFAACKYYPWNFSNNQSAKRACSATYRLKIPDIIQVGELKESVIRRRPSLRNSLQRGRVENKIKSECEATLRPYVKCRSAPFLKDAREIWKFVHTHP